MPLFAFFIVLAVLLGAGVMLSPAWPSSQPRVALAATLCLGLVMGGAVFYAEAFGWSTLVVDYLLFVLLAGVVLGGTLSTAQARAEARGERLADSDLGWPGPADLAFFALVASAVLIPLLSLPATLGAQGQVNGLHSLAVREGASFRTLAPFAADKVVLMAPGLHALTAYLSQALEQPIPLVQMSLTAAVVFLLVWLAYDFGAELRDKRLGRALASAMLLCAGIWRGILDGHSSELIALLFLLAFLHYSLRLLRAFSPADLIAGALMLGAVIYASLTLSIAALLASVALLALVWARRGSRVTAKSRWGLTLGLPLIALIGIAPWLVNNLPAMLPITPSPHRADISLIAEMTAGQGWLILPLALGGIVSGLRAAGSVRLVSRVMLLWLLLVLEASLLGLSGHLLAPLGDLTNAPNLARHGVVLPYVWFGGLALLSIWDNWLAAAVRRRLRRSAYPLIALSAVALLLLGAAFNPFLALMRPLLQLPPASLSHDDVAAMHWLRDHAPADALLLAADGEGWLPVFAERRARDFKALRYFEWDPVQPTDVEQADVDFVFVPAGAHPPPSLALELVFTRGQARVYAVDTG